MSEILQKGHLLKAYLELFLWYHPGQFVRQKIFVAKMIICKLLIRSGFEIL